MLSYEIKLIITRSSQQSLLKIPKWNNITCGKRSFEVEYTYKHRKMLKTSKRNLKLTSLIKSMSVINNLTVTVILEFLNLLNMV